MDPWDAAERVARAPRVAPGTGRGRRALRARADRCTERICRHATVGAQLGRRAGPGAQAERSGPSEADGQRTAASRPQSGRPAHRSAAAPVAAGRAQSGRHCAARTDRRSGRASRRAVPLWCPLTSSRDLTTGRPRGENAGSRSKRKCHRHCARRSLRISPRAVAQRGCTEAPLEPRGTSCGPGTSCPATRPAQQLLRSARLARCAGSNRGCTRAIDEPERCVRCEP